MTHTFVHLRVHSEYSLEDGIVRIKPLLARCAEASTPAVALTDLTNMYGLVKFYQSALNAGIKPIVATDLWVENPDKPDQPYRMPILCMNSTGYQNARELISRAYQQNQIGDKAQVKKEWLIDKNQGLILLSGANYGDVGQAVLRGHEDQAAELAGHWQKVFGDRYYLELHRTSRPGDQKVVAASVNISRLLHIPVVATNDVVFLDTDEYEAHETRVAICESMALDDPRRQQRFSEEQYLKSSQQMSDLFSDIPSAVENTLLIAQRCNVQIRLGEYFLPEFPIPDNFREDPFFERHSWESIESRVTNAMRVNQPDADDQSDAWKKQLIEGIYFQKVSIEGLEDRLKKIFPDDEIAADPELELKKNIYYDRLSFELDIIIQMGFPGYFLIVMDFIQWAKKNDIPVGPGRGSGAGSLVAYAQKITDLDPIQYDLLFERFLNPERVSMPDFDVDFCMEKRDKVISYVADTYGRDAVSQIVTFGTMAAKAVVRDVARVQGKSYGLADKISKLIPGDPGMTLAKAKAETDDLRSLLAADEEAQEIWAMAEKLEGIARQTGKHAGGVVIAPTKLTDFAPLSCEQDGTGLVTQFDKNDVESAGLVKFDFLGLRTLTIIDWAVKMINELRKTTSEPPLVIEDIPLDDAESFALLKKAETTAVFQLESRGMKELIKKLQPDNLEDMIALVALFRPGPLDSGMVDDFIDRKHRRAKVAYPHPDFEHELLRPVLEPTYGVVVYQEQVMQIGQVLAGYSLGGADLLRRAMGKKKPEEMVKQRELFRTGAESQGINPELAMKIFDLVEKFAGYGFNKSHSAAYALVSYQTLWLKTHYPAAFMAAVMSSDMQNTDKVVTFIEDSRHMGLTLLPPDVNQGEYMFTVNPEQQVIYGLGAVKGVGEGPVAAIVEARSVTGAFSDLFDFCQKVDSRVNKRVIEALIKSGAFDTIIPSRAVAMACMEDAVRTADQTARNADAGMMDLFGEATLEAASDPYQPYRNAESWTPRQSLRGEKETLGLYLTGHPIDEYEHEVNMLCSCRLSDLQPGRRGETQTLAGLIVDRRTMITRQGKKMTFLTLDDRTGRIEMTLYEDDTQFDPELLTQDIVLVAEVEVTEDRFSDRIRTRVKRLSSFEEARSGLIQSISLTIEHPDASLIERLSQIVREDSEGAPVVIQYRHPEADARIRLAPRFRVPLDDGHLHRVRQLFGDEQVRLNYRNQDISLV